MHTFEGRLQLGAQDGYAQTDGNGDHIYEVSRLSQPDHDEIVDPFAQEKTIGLDTTSATAPAAEKSAPTRENPSFIDEVGVVKVGSKAYRISLTSYWDVLVKHDPRFKGSSRHSQTVIEHPEFSKIRVLQVSAAGGAVSRRRAVAENTLNLKFVTRHVYGQRNFQEAGFTVELQQLMEALQRPDAIMELEPVGDDVPKGYVKRHFPDVLALTLPDPKDPQTLNVLVLVAPLEEEAEHLVVSDTLGQAQDILQRTLEEILEHMPVDKRYEYIEKFKELDAQAAEDEPEATHRRARRVIEHLRYLAEHEYKVQPAVTAAPESQPATVHQETVQVATESRWQRLLAWIRSWSKHNKEPHEVAFDEPVQTVVAGLEEARFETAESHTKALDEFITAIRSLLLTGIRNTQKPFDARIFGRLYPHTQESFNSAVSKLRHDSGMSDRQLHQAVMAELQKAPPTPQELGTLSLDSMYAHVSESLKFFLEIPASDITALTDTFFSLLIETAAVLEKKKTPLKSGEFDTRSYLIEAGMRLLETPDFTYEEIQDELMKRWLAEPGYGMYDRESLRQIVAAVLTTSAQRLLRDIEKKDTQVSWHELQKLQAELDRYIAEKSETATVPLSLIEHILRFKKAGLCKNALTRLYVINGERGQRSDEGAAIIALVYTESAQLQLSLRQRLLGKKPPELKVVEPPQIKLLNTLGILWEKTSRREYDYDGADFETMRATIWQLTTEHGYTVEQIMAELQEKKGIKGAKFILENAFSDQVFEEYKKLPEDKRELLDTLPTILRNILTAYQGWSEAERQQGMLQIIEIFFQIRAASIHKSLLDRATRSLFIFDKQIQQKVDQMIAFLYSSQIVAEENPELVAAGLQQKLDKMFGLVTLTQAEVADRDKANKEVLDSLCNVLFSHVTAPRDYFDYGDRISLQSEADSLRDLVRELAGQGYTADYLTEYFFRDAQEKKRDTKVIESIKKDIETEIRIQFNNLAKQSS